VRCCAPPSRPSAAKFRSVSRPVNGISEASNKSRRVRCRRRCERGFEFSTEDRLCRQQVLIGERHSLGTVQIAIDKIFGRRTQPRDRNVAATGQVAGRPVPRLAEYPAHPLQRGAFSRLAGTGMSGGRFHREDHLLSPSRSAGCPGAPPSVTTALAEPVAKGRGRAHSRIGAVLPVYRSPRRACRSRSEKRASMAA